MKREDPNQYWSQIIKEHKDWYFAGVGDSDSHFQPSVKNTLSAKYSPLDIHDANRFSPATQHPELLVSTTNLLATVKKNTPPTVEFADIGDESSDYNCYDTNEGYQLSKKRKKKR